MTRTKKQSTEAAVREIRRRTRRKFAPEEKIRIVLEGLRGEQSISELCRREGIAANLYYRWSKDFLEAGRKQLAGDTLREATSDEVKELRAENSELKEVVTEITLENRVLKKSLTGLGEEDDTRDRRHRRRWRSSAWSSRASFRPGPLCGNWVCLEARFAAGFSDIRRRVSMGCTTRSQVLGPAGMRFPRRSRAKCSTWRLNAQICRRESSPVATQTRSAISYRNRASTAS